LRNGFGALSGKAKAGNHSKVDRYVGIFSGGGGMWVAVDRGLASGLVTDAADPVAEEVLTARGVIGSGRKLMTC